MTFPYNPFLSGPEAEQKVHPGDRVVTVPAEEVPDDRIGFNRLAFESGYQEDADLFFAANRWLGFMASSMGEVEDTEGDSERIRNLTDENGNIRLIHTRAARIANLDIRA